MGTDILHPPPNFIRLILNHKMRREIERVAIFFPMNKGLKIYMDVGFSFLVFHFSQPAYWCKSGLNRKACLRLTSDSLGLQVFFKSNFFLFSSKLQFIKLQSSSSECKLKVNENFFFFFFHFSLVYKACSCNFSVIQKQCKLSAVTTKSLSSWEI